MFGPYPGSGQFNALSFGEGGGGGGGEEKLRNANKYNAKRGDNNTKRLFVIRDVILSGE